MKSIGKYRVIEDLGGSATGQTYRTRDTFRNREFAVKVLKSVPDLGAEARERFCGHLTSCADLTHRHIARVHDLGEVDEGIFVATEWRSGLNLRGFMPAHQDLPLDQKLALIAQIAEGLAFAHSRGIAHGNLRPSNVFVDTERDVTLLDFGAAKWLEILLNAGHRPEGLVAKYLAPEQILDQPFDARSDIFALGLILYEFASGRYPFSADAGVIPREIVHSEPEPLRQLDAQIPEALEQLVARALKKDPDQRIQTADELASGLYIAAQQFRRVNVSTPATQAPAVEPIESGPIVNQAAQTSQPAPALTPEPIVVQPDPVIPQPQNAVAQASESPAVQEAPVTPSPVRKRPQDVEPEPRPWTARSYATSSSPTVSKEVPPLRPVPPPTSADADKQPLSPPPGNRSPAPPPKAPAYEPPQSFLMPDVLPPQVPKTPHPPGGTMTKGVLVAAVGLILAAAIVSSLVSRQSLRASPEKSHLAIKATQPMVPAAKPLGTQAASVSETLAPKPTEPGPGDLANTELSAKQTLNGPVRRLWESGRYAKALAFVDQVLAADPTNEEARAWRTKIREAQAAEAALK